MSTNGTETINTIIDELDLHTHLSNADWGREFADLLYDSGDEDAIRYALADAGEGYRSAALSRTRKAATKARRTAIKHGGNNGSDVAYMQRQLDFQVAFEGVAPRQLRDCDHAFLVQAVIYQQRKVIGAQRNLLFLQNAEDLTSPWPGKTIRDLIANGMISSTDFDVNNESEAA